MEDFGKISLGNLVIVLIYTLIFATWPSPDYFGIPVLLVLAVVTHTITVIIISVFHFARRENALGRTFILCAPLVFIVGSIGCVGVSNFLS